MRYHPAWLGMMLSQMFHQGSGLNRDSGDLEISEVSLYGSGNLRAALLQYTLHEFAQ
jgi:hypothetical protein